MKPIAPVPQVDLPRFMGAWYVIAHIPSFVERNAYDAVESYALRPDGRIQTTFLYRNGSFDAPLKTMRPVGHRRCPAPATPSGACSSSGRSRLNTSWRISTRATRETIIARDARDYAWIMARTPTDLR